MVKQIQCLMYPCNCCNFFNKNLYCCFCPWVLQFYFNPLTPMQAMTSLGLPLLTSSLLTKIGITFTQLLQVEKIFPIIPRSECSAFIGAQDMHKKLSEKRKEKFPAITSGYSMVKFAQKCSKSWVKNAGQNFLPLTPGCSMLKFAISVTLSRSFLIASKPILRRSITAAKR